MAKTPKLNDNDVTDDELAEIASMLRDLEREGGWSRVTAIGHLMIARFFAGDPAAWHSSARRNRSLRRLAAHPLCPLEKSALSEVVGVYVATREDPSLLSFTSLTPSHVARVLPLETAARRRLLREAEEQQMRVRSLAERVRQVREGAQPESVRQRSSGRKVFNRMQDALSMLREARLTLESLPELDDNILRLTAETLKEFEDEMTSMRAITSRLIRSLRPSAIESTRTEVETRLARVG